MSVSPTAEEKLIKMRQLTKQHWGSMIASGAPTYPADQDRFTLDLRSSAGVVRATSDTRTFPRREWSASCFPDG